MLVLTRKIGQQIRINSNIIIKVVKSGRNSVKIGIDAPISVYVVRDEVFHDRGEELRALAGV